MHLIYVLFTCGLQIHIFNLFWTHMYLQHIAHHIWKKIKINNIKITFYHKKCITNNIDANTRIKKLSNAFINAQQMFVRLVAYLVLSLSLYHSSRTFQFINISPFEERAFVLKSQVALNELEPNSNNIMCSSIIDKYIYHFNQYQSLS
jgi:hypothetical protein